MQQEWARIGMFSSPTPAKTRRFQTAPAPKFRRQANQFANDLKSAVKEIDVYAMLVP
jgi:hypothetical protein